MHDEQPLRFLHHVGVAMADAVCDGIEDHEGRMHVPSRPTAPLRAVPFPNDRIPDAVLARMIEMLENLETQDIGVAIVARTFGYPESLVLRELADYKARFRRFIAARANA